MMVVLFGREQYYGRLALNFSTLLLCLFLMFSPSYQVITNCSLKVGAQFYDLSSLSQQSWKVKIGEEKPLYATISLCNQTHESLCGPVGVCITNQTAGFPGGDVMIVKEAPTIGNLTAVFEGNATRKISAEITFFCANKIGEPRYISFQNNHLRLTWYSIAACPVHEPSAHNSCSFNLPGDIEFLNLQPLRHKEFYNVTVNGHQYYINLCGGVLPKGICGTDENVTVCDKTDNGTTVLGLVSRQQVVYSGGLAIEYKSKGKGKKPTAKIDIVCNATVQTEELKFKAVKDNITHVFELETPWGCVKGPIDCSVYDVNYYMYDLSGLREMQHVIEDQRTDFKGYQYYLGICRPLNLTGDKNCSGGVSACLKFGNTSISLGTLSDGPHVDKSEQVSLVYSGGAVCNGTHRYTTVINFVCSKTNREAKLESVSEDCVYLFVWNTQLACPMTSSIGRDCRVNDKVMGYDFDLSPLRKSHDYVIISTDGNFRINICGPLATPCAGNNNTSVCFTDAQNVEHAIGEPATAPHYDDGRLSFVLDGDSCDSSPDGSTVYIIFNCGHGARNNVSNPEYLVKVEGCRFSFLWQTDISCKDYKVFNCSVTDDKGETYDLSPLSQPTYNYIVMGKNRNGGLRKFFINVCRSILFGHDAKCRPETGVCSVDISQPNRQKSFKNLGRASALTFNKSRKTIQLIYENGDLCGDSYEKSIINFTCDSKDKGNSNPELVKESSCSHEFLWKTKFACPKSDGPKQDNCKHYTSYADTEFDLTPLAKDEQTFGNEHGQKFRLKVCGSLVYTNTTRGAGICYEKGENYCENWGMGNSKLIVDTTRVYLNYTDGTECSPGLKMNTIIEFICGETDSGPRYLDNPSNCTHVVNWITSLACRENVPCIAHSDMRDIDLSLLINDVDNYNITINGSTFFINVCRPLVTKEGLHCYGGSAACRADFQGGKNWTNEVSLGYPHVSPQVTKHTVTLKYFSGSRCPNMTYHNYSTAIIFSCDPYAGIGGPIFVKFSTDCQYIFSWKTSVICKDNEMSIEADDQKIFTNNQNNMSVDFNTLCKEYKVDDYSVKMCDEGSLGSVYKTKEKSQISYGKPQSVIFSYSDNGTKIFLADGDKCDTKKTDKNSAVLHFHCGADKEEVSVLKELECRVELLVKTKTDCFVRQPPPSPADKKVPTSKRTVSVAGVIFGILVAVMACSLVIFLRKAENRSWCRSKLCNLLNRRHQGQFHYSMEDWSDS